MSVKVTVKLNTSKINTLIEAHKKALEMTADVVLSDIKTSAVVPKDTSILEDSAFVDRSELINCIMRIVFDTPYARRLYWHPEYNFRKDKNPNAQGKWMDSYLYGDNKQFIIDTYSKFLKMLSEGLIK
ncbi:minor capsid protein [Clostridium cadaveris]|uniref:minor capsid protein n=1 Tax=Clostridium cadaveris TaxID=1529 RepID=UPI001E566F6F|nr:minor capsid protein [Clostridium cadaveris]UFH65585.1 minor capsid protein [Clostridium cadaveris]